MNRGLDACVKFAALFVIGVAVCVSQGSLDGASRAEAKMPTVKIGASNIVKLEVAATEREIERGLMYRTSLPEDQGMVFLFHPPRPVNFWMYHTLIPLDMLFVKDGKIIKIFENVPPCKSENPKDCPTYPPAEGLEVTEVIELVAGYAKKHEVKVGDSISFDMP